MIISRPATFAASAVRSKVLKTRTSRVLRDRVQLSEGHELVVIAAAEVHPMAVTEDHLAVADAVLLGEERTNALKTLVGRRFDYKWQLEAALSEGAEVWRAKPEGPLNKDYNQTLSETYDYLYRHLSLEGDVKEATDDA